MITQEVSLVDVAANLRRWVVLKNQKGEGTTMTAKAMKMPSSARQSIMDGLSQILDQLAGIGTSVGEAEVDDTAPVPPELIAAIEQCGEMLDGLVEQFGGTDDDTGAAGAAGAGAAGGEGAGAGAGAGGVAASAGAKAMVTCPSCGVQVDGSTGKCPKCDAALPAPGAAPAKAMCEHCGQAVTEQKAAELSKAGKKIKGTRLAALKELTSKFSDLIKELDDEAAAEGGTAKGAQTQTAKADADAAIKKQLDTFTSKIGELTTTIEKQAGELAALKREPGVSHARQPEGGGAQLSDVKWAPDMSADLAKRRRDAAKK